MARQLEIGPGKSRLEGFQTLDISAREGVDVVADAGCGLPFQDNTYDLIYASHILEHIPWYKTEDTLREWVRILKPDGTLEIWVPDGYKIWQMFLETMADGEDEIAKDGFWRCNPDKNPYLWLNGRLFTYGDGTGKEDPNWHRAIFTYGYLEQLLTKVGLVDIYRMDRTGVRGHDHGVINLGVKGRKPNRDRRVNYRTIEDLNRDIKRLAAKLPEDVGLVVGIPRSGLLAANLLALYRNLWLTDIKGVCEGRLIEAGRTRGVQAHSPDSIRSIVVVDDSIYSGATMEEAKEAIRQANLPYKIYYAAIYTTNSSKDKVDFWVHIVEPPRIFEWNVMHGRHLCNACVDLDGVLCRDPSETENDDGVLYRGFLTTVEPLVKPSFEIGWIVTSRLEKYRVLTEEWLRRHSIQYRNLIMMGYPNKATRVSAKAYGPYKADTYKATGASLFIESSPILAEEILALSGKPVLCMDGELVAATRDQAVAPLLRAFQTSLTQKTQEVQHIREDVIVQIAQRCVQHCDSVSRLLPPHLRHMIIVSLRCILAEGWVAFTHRGLRFCLRKARPKGIGHLSL